MFGERGFQHARDHRRERQRQRDRWHRHVCEHVSGDAPAQAEETLGQGEVGGEAKCPRRVVAARDRQHRQENAEQHDEGEAPKEVRHRENETGRGVNCDFSDAPGEAGAEHGQRAPQQYGDGRREHHQFQRRWQTPGDQACHILACGDGDAETAGQGLAGPDDELTPQRLVEAIQRV